ncbi:hypothetical protein OEA41_009506 [Lepraria neglecta]|uniref:3-dehydroquinate synthase N-terminal domain-containing protein n=1 Tax=Lepraria neglecta TaxID=209136 RepID=A0AAD9Z1X6_9LECA|nr:hypothetical protein OEA41_009506 [Lepraria neglecta]
MAVIRLNTNYIRVPTTVIGLIDASVSIKVAVNYGNYKNRLGAYHAPMHTFLDFTFLRTLPTAQLRNGFAELIKISTCSHLDTFNLWDMYYEELIDTGFGRTNGLSEEVRAAANKIKSRRHPRDAQARDTKPSRDWLGPGNRIWAYVSCSSIQKFRGH